MKRLALLTLIVFYTLPGPYQIANSQPKSDEKLFNKSRESIEISVEKRTGATVIYTKPNRSLDRPEIQMIAQFISLDSINSYKFRVEIITRRVLANSKKIFVKSSSGLHVFEAGSDNLTAGSRIVKEVVSWGCRHQSECTSEGYNYTFFLETSKEIFFDIISSSDIKVIFSHMRTPKEEIADADIYKMNDLNTYLKGVQNNSIYKL
jgi:hypothetical protein